MGAETEGREVAIDTGADYEALPYVSHPIAETQPAHLAALAQLAGLTAPDVPRARVLELGCASGGNLLPLALRFPEASFTGIDLSPRHVAEGRALRDAVGAPNLTLTKGDIAAPGAVSGTFDYILCHGVFSWVPEATQQALLALIARHLAPSGLAYVSYNVRAGWHARGLVRDIFRAGDDPSEPPHARVAAAKARFAHVVQASDAETPYGAELRAQSAALVGASTTYLMAEYLAADNCPFAFPEFVSTAKTHGLAYVCDARPASHVRDLTAVTSGTDFTAAAHLRDLATGRAHRQSVLAHAAHMPDHIAPSPNRLAGLHLSTTLRIDRSAASDRTHLRTADGHAIQTNDTDLAQALDALGASTPDTIPFQDFIANAKDQAGQDRLASAALRLAMAGHVNLSTAPHRSQPAETNRPEVWTLARAQLAAGQDWVTSQSHTAVTLDPIAQTIVPLIDGTRTQDDLIATWQRFATERPELKITLPPGGAAALNTAYLAHLRRLGLLAPSH
ncbi:methyltransferase domain-containing protein [Pseudaestuariivita sp.]|uniref:methyltransferase domain-containing protein n=1 Tax=Pseudaestuariivita sp. TaxID=2211669 RepID=UPI004058FB75